jgi:hypothetical protein
MTHSKIAKWVFDKVKLGNSLIPNIISKNSKTAVKVKLIEYTKIITFSGGDSSPDRKEGEEWKVWKQFRELTFVTKKKKVLFDLMRLGWNYDQNLLIVMPHPNIPGEYILLCGNHRMITIGDLINAGLWCEQDLVPVWVVEPSTPIQRDTIGAYELEKGKNEMVCNDAIRMGNEAIAAGYIAQTKKALYAYYKEVKPDQSNSYTYWITTVLRHKSQQVYGRRRMYHNTAKEKITNNTLSIDSQIVWCNTHNHIHQYTDTKTPNLFSNNVNHIHRIIGFEERSTDLKKAIQSAFNEIIDHINDHSDNSLKYYFSTWVTNPPDSFDELCVKRETIQMDFEMKKRSYIRTLAISDCLAYDIDIEEATERRTKNFPIEFFGFLPQPKVVNGVNVSPTGVDRKSYSEFVNLKGEEITSPFNLTK